MLDRSALSPQLIDAVEAGAIVLTSNQRSAHLLKLRYANHAVAQGRTAWATPAIHSMNTFVLQLWRTQGHTHERVLSAEQSQMVWERIVASSKWSEQLLSPRAAASTAFRSWERLQSWCISRADLIEQSTATEGVESRALWEWSERFNELCRERSWLPVARLPERLIETEIAAADLRLATVASEDLAPNHRALLKYLAGRGARCEPLRSPGVTGALEVVECESPEHELRSAALWARQQLREGLRSIAVVVPDLNERAMEVRRVFADVLAPATRTFDTSHAIGNDRAQQEASFAVAGYHRLADFPIVRAALDLLRLAVGRASSTLVGGILRSPFLAASVQEGSQRALADARLRSHVREHYDLASLDRIATPGCPLLGRCLREAQTLRLAAPSRALPSAMAEQFIELWRAFGWPGDTSLDSDEQQIAARIQACLAEFGALDDLLGVLGFANAVREFELLVQATNFEPRSFPAPIVILDQHSMSGMQFDALRVTGMDESRWPPPASPDPFIPIALQVRVGMPFAAAKLALAQAQRQLRDLQSAADRIVFSWASSDQDVDILPSPLLDGLSLHADTAVLDTYAMQMFAVKPQLETVKEDAAPALVDGYGRGGALIFELQAMCPFRAFAQLRLDARPLDSKAPNIDARERGTLIHAALADLWQTLGGLDGLLARTPAQLEVSIRTLLARHAEKLLDGASPHRIRLLQIEQELATERILALLALDRQRSPFQVAQRPETKEHARVGNLQFELRLDRMDELLDAQKQGQRVIIDYKTGNNVSMQSWARDRPEQPQLPLYAVTHRPSLVAVAFATLGAKGVAYQGVARDDDVLPGIQAFNGKHPPSAQVEWSGLLDYWERVIARLANEFATGDARVDPLPSACRYCHLSTLCRVREQAITPEDVEGGT